MLNNCQPYLGRIRTNKKAWSIEKAIALIEEAGQHFDPQLVPKFIECLPKIMTIKNKYSEDI